MSYQFLGDSNVTRVGVNLRAKTVFELVGVGVDPRRGGCGGTSRCDPPLRSRGSHASAEPAAKHHDDDGGQPEPGSKVLGLERCDFRPNAPTCQLHPLHRAGQGIDMKRRRHSVPADQEDEGMIGDDNTFVGDGPFPPLAAETPLLDPLTAAPIRSSPEEAQRSVRERLPIRVRSRSGRSGGRRCGSPRSLAD
jgi:hypothetical protein